MKLKVNLRIFWLLFSTKTPTKRISFHEEEACWHESRSACQKKWILNEFIWDFHDTQLCHLHTDVFYSHTWPEVHEYRKWSNQRQTPFSAFTNASILNLHIYEVLFCFFVCFFQYLVVKAFTLSCSLGVWFYFTEFVSSTLVIIWNGS